MKCLRCGGTMIRDKFYSSNDCFWGLKCVICGEIIDPLIIRNRMSLSMIREVSQPRKRMTASRARLASGEHRLPA